MNIYNKDLNTLMLFKVLYEEQNLSRAAERLSLSQPALSHRLNKLRQDFGDPLFVRASRGLTMTPFAEKNAKRILSLSKEMEALYQSINVQDFLNTSDKINIFATDLIEQILLPSLLQTTQSKAPHMQISMRNARGSLPKDELQNGLCDIAIAGFFDDIPEGFYQQFLCSHPFVVLAHKNNPHVKEGLTLSEFTECPHVMVTLSGELNSHLDKTLKNIGLTRNVISGYSSFLAPQALIAQQPNVLFTCVKPIAEYATKLCPDLVIHECPVKLASVEYVQIWHERTHNDPLRKWLRKQIKTCMAV